MTTSTSRDLIAVLQTTLDGRILDADGGSDWVDSWADGLELLPPVDGFVLGAGMFSGYEQFWAAMLEDPAAAAEMLGRDPYPREIAYAETAARTEHLVLSATLTDVAWPSARIVRSIEQIRTFKDDGDGTVYVVGGPTLITSLLDAGLLDELRLIVHPILVGAGRSITGVLAQPTTPGARRGRTCRGRTRDAHLSPAPSQMSDWRSDPNGFNESVIHEFRANGGVVGGELAGMPLLLLTTIDARSGQPRTTPLAYHRRGNRYLVIASNGGAARNPAWFRNLERDPDVTVEVGVETFAATATILEASERDAVFASIVAEAPSAGAFQAKAGRTIPVIELGPRLDGAAPESNRQSVGLPTASESPDPQRASALCTGLGVLAGASCAAR